MAALWSKVLSDSVRVQKAATSRPPPKPTPPGPPVPPAPPMAWLSLKLLSLTVTVPEML
jgi:hypothetical protein